MRGRNLRSHTPGDGEYAPGDLDVSLSLAIRCVKLPGCVTRKRNMTHAGDVAQICCNQGRLRLSFGELMERRIWLARSGSQPESPPREGPAGPARPGPGSVHEACGAARPPAVYGVGHGQRLGPVCRAARARTPGVPRLRGRRDPAGAAFGPPRRGPRPESRGWAAVHALRRGREHYAAEERVLGSSVFVEALVSCVCVAVHLAPTALQESGLFLDDYSATKLSSRGNHHSRCGASEAVSLLDDLVRPVLLLYADSVSI